MTALIGPMRYSVQVLLNGDWKPVRADCTLAEAISETEQWYSQTRILAMEW